MINLTKLTKKEHKEFEAALHVFGIDVPKSIEYSVEEGGYIINHEKMKQDESTQYLTNAFNFALMSWCLSIVSKSSVSKEM